MLAERLPRLAGGFDVSYQRGCQRQNSGQSIRHRLRLAEYLLPFRTLFRCNWFAFSSDRNGARLTRTTWGPYNRSSPGLGTADLISASPRLRGQFWRYENRTKVL